jgi:hypothetical protein
MHGTTIPKFWQSALVRISEGNSLPFSLCMSIQHSLVITDYCDMIGHNFKRYIPIT